MPDIICDKFNVNNGAKGAGRFVKGVEMRILLSDYVKFHLSRSYISRKITCCQEVKETKYNWLYVIPDRYHEDISSWIKELIPIFPTLGMEIIEVDRYDVPELIDEEINLEFDNIVDGSMITVRLKLGEQSSGHYSYTNSRNFEYGEIGNLKYLVLRFLAYCSKSKVSLSEDTVHKLAEEFLSGDNNSRDFIRKEVSLVIRDAGIYTLLGEYLIDDIDNLDMMVFLNYLEKMYGNNVEKCNPIVKSLERNNGKISLLKVLYTKSRYTVEKYLAHILIRAAFSNETLPFIKQYYTIKEAMPELYFWNIIFLTQFGFDMNYYWWLTEQRIFKFTTEEEFSRCAKEYSGISSQIFFSNYFVRGRYPRSYLLRLKTFYEKEDFKTVVDSLSNSLVVTPTDKLREKNRNFIISDTYDVALYSDKYYYVLADDYRIKKCSKSNFNIVNK